MIIKTRLINLKKPVLIFGDPKDLQKNSEYYFEFTDLDYKLHHPFTDNPKKIKRKLQNFNNKLGFELGTKLKGFLKLEYQKDYNLRILGQVKNCN